LTYLEEKAVAPLIAIAALWALWLLSWIVAAFWADPAAKRPAAGEQTLYRLATIGGAVALSVGDRFDGGPLWLLGSASAWLLVGLAALGLAFTWWARLYLGRLWSSSVTRKADHRVVDTGPYAIVRHPIYTGIIVALYATAVLKASPLGIAGVLLMTYGFWLKAKLEERFLSEQLGAEAYGAYRREVPMLVPFGPRSA
jgi:protein-S-isoprenylcysteine O-methyltransferase Ste14